MVLRLVHYQLALGRRRMVVGLQVFGDIGSDRVLLRIRPKCRQSLGCRRRRTEDVGVGGNVCASR